MEPVSITHRPAPADLASSRDKFGCFGLSSTPATRVCNSLAIPSRRPSTPHSGWHAVVIATARQVPPTLDSRHATTTTHPHDTHHATTPASEVVVGEDGKRRRRRRRDNPPEIKDGIVHFDQTPDDAAVSCSKDDRPSRECPVPRPGGMLGEWLGFHAEKKVDERTN
ncbi:hypothetical protein HYQ45_009653 [Verticillium longisporum]|uniref:Uncharacterized protein n=1 Tax=Verticillium longisporum TaxID=100787 RepID=A0A8I2ZL68_VERLO|nr:hypothetical protein HYQ45_009653 [Verticillium longisporum]